MYRAFCKFCNISKVEFEKKKVLALGQTEFEKQKIKEDNGGVINFNFHNKDCKVEDPNYYPDQGSGIPQGGVSLATTNPFSDSFQTPFITDEELKQQVEAAKKKEEEARKKDAERKDRLSKLNEKLRLLNLDW